MGRRDSAVGPEAFGDAVERGLADGVIVSGAATGRATDDDDLRAAVAARDEAGLDTPVFVGSGVTAETVGETLSVADGVIVGSALKAGGDATNPVSVERVERLVAAADVVR
jgi:predicted TIM-barrel enzyme